jgi:DNA-binding GntR family transcriptional regulator
MDLKSWLELDKKMHEILARAAQNRMLEEQLQSLRNHFERLVRMVGLFSDQLASSLKPAAKALGEGDQTRLEKILSDHVKDQVRLIQKRFTFDLDKIA